MNGSYTATFTVTDDDGGETSDTVAVTVNNVAPQNVNAGADQTVSEGTPVNLSGSFTDPGSADTHLQSWSVSASNGQVIPSGSGASFSFVPHDNGTYTVTYTLPGFATLRREGIELSAGFSIWLSITRMPLDLIILVMVNSRQSMSLKSCSFHFGPVKTCLMP